MRQSVQGLFRILEEWWQRQLSLGIPAQHLTNQLPSGALPPASGSARGGVKLSDATPAATGVADAGTSVDASRGDHVHSSSGSSSLTIEEVDGSPTESAPTKLIFPNGTLAVSSHEVTYTPSGGGGGNVSSTGAVGSEPGSPASGDLYLPNNGAVIERYSGSAWTHWGPIFPLHDPTIPSWSWVNQGGATIDTTAGGIYLLAPANGSMSMRVRTKAVPTAPYLIDIAFSPLIFAENYGLVSFGWRDSSGGGLVHARFGYVSGWQLAHIYSNSATSDNTAVKQTVWSRGAPRFIRLQDDNTNRKVWISEDGQHWLLFYSESRTAFLTPDQVFFGADSRTLLYDCGVTLLSWYEH